MKPAFTRSFTAAAAALCLLLGGTFNVLAGEVMVPAAGKSPTIDQIKEQGELRVGVAVAVPWLGQDPSNGQYFGASYEVASVSRKCLGSG